MTKSISSVSLVMVKVDYLQIIGDSFVKTILKLCKYKKEESIYSIDLLAAIAIELLCKCYIASDICVKNIDRDEICLELLINDKFRKFYHHLDKLLSYPEIKKSLNIKSISRYNNGLLDEYRIILNSNNEPIFIKTLEAARYGSFSSNNDVVKNLGKNNINQLLVILKNLSNITKDKIKDTKGKI